LKVSIDNNFTNIEEVMVEETIKVEVEDKVVVVTKEEVVVIKIITIKDEDEELITLQSR